nr:DUF3280 domain-containing protein [Paracoccus saliphilus]
MNISRHILILSLVIAPFGAMGQTAARPAPQPGQATWFGIHYLDTSTEGEINGVRADETARLAMIEDYIAEDLTKRGFTLAEPPAEAVADIKNPVHSNGADTRIAAEMGSDYAIAGEVQKVSNLIQSVNLYVRDAESGQTLRAGSVEIRGNTDDAYRRGYSYLLRNIIFRED